MGDTGGRVQWADAARGLAIALVVLHHTAKRSAVAGSADWWLTLTEVLQTVRMPLFFAVAGLFAATWVNGQRSWPALLRSKVLLFAWVYVLWLALRFVWTAAVPGGREPQTLTDLAWRLVLPGTGWFIVALAAMFVIARATRRVPTPLVLLTASVVSIVFLADGVRLGNQTWDGVGTYAVFFLVGVTLRGHILVLAERVPRWATVLVPLAWAGTYAALAAAGLQEAPVVGFLLRLLGIAAGISVALLVQHRSWLRALGRRTLPVYMTHQLLIVSLVSAVAAVASFDTNLVLHQAGPLLLAVLLVALTYGVGVLAPRIGLGWLFATPAWLDRLSGADGDRTTRGEQSVNKVDSQRYTSP